MQNYLDSFLKIGFLTVDLLLIIFIGFDYSTGKSTKKIIKLISLSCMYFLIIIFFSFLITKWKIFYFIYYYLIGLFALLSFKFFNDENNTSIWFRCIICVSCYYITQELSFSLIESLSYNEMIKDNIVEYIIHYLILFIIYIIVYFTLIKNYKNNRIKIENSNDKLLFFNYYFFHAILISFQYFIQNKKNILISLALVAAFYSFIQIIILYFAIRQKYSDTELSVVKQL